jgi:hypothetical protein
MLRVCDWDSGVIGCIARRLAVDGIEVEQAYCICYKEMAWDVVSIRFT